MLDCGGEEAERGAQCLFGVSKAAVSGLVPDLRETLADFKSSRLPDQQAHAH